ncbi:MAG: hypothetical protein Q8942_07175 [Bacillota bacterium]|nr:hypothetical protein [Bacillota bacterium]
MDTMKYVEYMLKNYTEIKTDIELLKFDLECFEGIKHEETIEDLTFSHSNNERVQTSALADRTSKVAMIYKQVTARLNKESINEIKRKISLNEFEISRLEYCVRKLKIPIGNIIEDLYFNKLSMDKICIKASVSERTVNRYRKKGLEELADMYEKRRLAI